MSRSTLVLIATLGAAHLALSARQRRQRLALDAVQMHGHMLTEVAAEPKEPKRSGTCPATAPRTSTCPWCR